MLYRLKRVIFGHKDSVYYCVTLSHSPLNSLYRQVCRINPKKKPDYDSARVLDELCDTVAVLYGEGMTLRQISDEIELATIKVRKLLITVGVYRSDIADEVNTLFRAGFPVKQIQLQLGLSAASVSSYLPYTKVVYKAEECSVLADRIRLHRARKAVVKKLENNPDVLWECLTLFAGYPFKTSKGLSFTYTIKGNEIFVTRKEKSITRATVLLAYEKTVVLGDMATGPKTLGCFGASYLYPVFRRIGVIQLPLLEKK